MKQAHNLHVMRDQARTASFQRAGAIAASVVSLAGAGACTVQFLQWRNLEGVLATGYCGAAFTHAMMLGQCSHCWAVASLALAATSMAPWSSQVVDAAKR